MKRPPERDLGAGFKTVIAGCLAAVALMAGGSWIIAVSAKARSDVRASIAVAPQPGRLVLAQLAVETIQTRPAAVAGTAAVVRKAVLAEADVLKPVKVRAVTVPGFYLASYDPRNDVATTGSVGPTSEAPAKLASAMPAELPAPAASPASAAAPAGNVEALINPNSPPMPRARPKVASLQPPTDMGTRQEDGGRSPKAAIYDITAGVVYMPNGERLEAHSGYGSMMDDPRYVHKRMRGATPPNTYKLKMREALFHGVEAIRMTPVGEGNMFGRDGILAHTYMLGSTGQSNGCVSFKNYPRFLAAFKRGEVEHMVVVSRLDRPPTAVARRDTLRRGDDTL